MTGILEKIHTAGFSLYLYGFSAIDSWLGGRIWSGTDIQILTNAGTADLAKLFEDLRYPGADFAEAALDDNNVTYYFNNADSIHDVYPSFKILEFYKECKTGVFHDPGGIYSQLKEIRRGLQENKNGQNSLTVVNLFEIFTDSLNSNFELNRALMDAALILAKYFLPEAGAELQLDKIIKLFNGLRKGAILSQEEQRSFLCALMTSVNPGLGLELLKKSGFIGEHWNELALLEEAEHDKDFHPEGNAWEHTLETFRYRKIASRNGDAGSCARSYDLVLSLGLLLHDIGKPMAISAGSRRFDSHAELGEIQVRKFLGRLGFNISLINDVCFLVKNHMLVAALPRLPHFRTAEIMSSPLFPTLLELYRCDESSSFKGMDGYYESSAVYQSFLRNRRNPYRSADGKKLNRMSFTKV
jgi:poly(A) polymerase